MEKEISIAEAIALLQTLEEIKGNCKAIKQPRKKTKPKSKSKLKYKKTKKSEEYTLTDITVAFANVFKKEV